MAIIVTLFALRLTGLDIVIGIQWLEKLGLVVYDWGSLSMTISRGNQRYNIVAQPATQGYAISNSMMTQEVNKGAEVFVLAI